MAMAFPRNWLNSFFPITFLVNTTIGAKGPPAPGLPITVTCFPEAPLRGILASERFKRAGATDARKLIGPTHDAIFPSCRLPCVLRLSFDGRDPSHGTLACVPVPSKARVPRDPHVRRADVLALVMSMATSVHHEPLYGVDGWNNLDLPLPHTTGERV